MKVEFNTKQYDFDPQSCLGGTVFRATMNDQNVVIVKIHDNLYVQLGDNNKLSGPCGHNPKWFRGWENPRILERGESFTVTV